MFELGTAEPSRLESDTRQPGTRRRPGVPDGVPEHDGAIALQARLRGTGLKIRRWFTDREGLFADVLVDLARGRVEKGGMPVLLPPTQMLLLRALAERPGEVVSREHLLTQVLGPQPRRKMSTLHVHMFTLRTLIEDDPHRPCYLRTIRGVGYVLEAVQQSDEDGREARPPEE